MWNYATEKKLFGCSGHSDEIVACVTPDRAYLVSGSKDKSIKIWDFTTGKEMKCFRKNLPSVRCISLSEDYQKILISGSGATCVVSFQTGDILFTFQLSAVQISICQDESFCVLLYEKDVLVYSLVSGSLVKTLQSYYGKRD